MTISQWIQKASTQLADAMIPTARLDAEIILAHTLRKSKTWLHAHDDEEIDERRHDVANARLELRLERTPVAYIVGHKEFYGRLFKVTPDVLVPRPDSEAVVTTALDWLNNSAAKRLVDVGTGSGCIGISLALEAPNLDVSLIDISPNALKIAEQNSTALGAKTRLIAGSLLDNFPMKSDIIVANLPYVATDWAVSPDTEFEPDEALYAMDGGLELIKKLIDQTPGKLTSGGLLVLEADPRQFEDINDYAKPRGLSLYKIDGFAISFTSRAA